MRNARKVISDIVIPQKKEITAQVFREPEPIIKHAPPSRNRKKGGRFAMMAIVFALILLTIIFFTSEMKIKIAPKKNTFDLNQTIALSLNPQIESELKFKTFSIPLTRKAVFSATTKASDAINAEGNIVVFNKGMDAQVLIASTRFETSDGKVYRISSGIVVPAARIVDGALVPGSKEVRVTADKAGSEYNIGLSDFTLPGLKSSSKYTLIYGRSKTEIKGGSSGEHMVVGKEDKSAASAKLITEAKEEAKNAVPSKLPQNEYLIVPTVEYSLFKESVKPAVGEAANEFEVLLEGEVRGVVLDRKELESFLLKRYSQNSGQGGGFSIKNLNELAVRVLSYAFERDSFKLQLTGKVELESIVNADAIKLTIMKNKLTDPGAILSAHQALSRVEVSFNPFWGRILKRFILSRPSAIDIILEER